MYTESPADRLFGAGIYRETGGGLSLIPFCYIFIERNPGTLWELRRN